MSVQRPAEGLTAATVDQYVTHDGSCWIWRGRPTTHGYGRITIAAVETAAHRAVYTMLVGPIPDGLELDHLCRVRLCVNPSHLEPVTQAENARRAALVITHCPHGHAYDDVNTYRRVGTGWRDCRTCTRIRISAARARQTRRGVDVVPVRESVA